MATNQSQLKSESTRDEILALIRSRELTSRENAFFPQNSREVYKDKKIEILKDSSRSRTGEDVDGEKVSGETCPLAQRQASAPVAFDFVSPPLESGTSCQERGGNVISPRVVSSREAYSGISVQHAKTDKGVKVFITLQTPEQAQVGACQLATAELKRYDRMREVKSRSEDSSQFNQYLENIKVQLVQEAKQNPAIKKSVCIGRLHQRRKRSQWLYDTLVIAFFNGSKIERVMLYLQGQEYTIDLDRELSRNQIDKYLSLGYHGEIQSARQIPTLADLPVVKFGGI